MSVLWRVLVVFVILSTHALSFRINLTGHKDFELNRFWTSTGFCPTFQDSRVILGSDDVIQNLIHISSLPRNGLQYVRIHWILDLIDQK